MLHLAHLAALAALNTSFHLDSPPANESWQVSMHSPNYVADDASIVFGARAMAVVLLDRLQRN
jgi:hypothetical protein